MFSTINPRIQEFLRRIKMFKIGFMGPVSYLSVYISLGVHFGQFTNEGYEEIMTYSYSTNLKTNLVGFLLLDKFAVLLLDVKSKIEELRGHKVVPILTLPLSSVECD